MNPQLIYQHLTSRGVPHIHALGMLSNIQAESGFDPAAIGDAGTSFGLFQHHGSRSEALREYSGGAWTDPQTQIEFALSEPETREYLAQDFSTPEEASRWFTVNWERPQNAQQKAQERAESISTLPISAFTQFSPERMAATMQPVSAPYPGMSPVAQPAVAAPQPSPLTALAVNPLFQIGMSLMAAGTSGRDLGTALQVGMTDAFRNQLLMEQIGERREQAAYERQAAAAQAQWEREKFERQEALAERKLGLGVGLPQQPEIVRIAQQLFPDDEDKQRDFILRAETGATKPPAGYRWTDETQTEVEPLPGMTKPPTESERMTRTYYESMRDAEDTIKGIEGAPQVEGGFSTWWANYGPQFLQSDASQKYRQAARQWIRAKLRKESGAAIGRDEEANEYRTYFPVPGDSDAVIEQKRSARRQAAASLLHQAGRAAPVQEEGATTSDGWTIERE